MRKKLQNWLSVAALLLSLFIFTPGLYGQTGFTQQDRETLIELKVTLREMDKRFEQIDKRFEQVDKRFEQVDKRISELREDMNKRFEQMMSFVWIVATIFGGMVAVTIGFALWDRRTMIRPFETKVAEIEGRITKNENKMGNFLAAIREYAASDKKFAALVERFNIL
jgi:predicted  nucleic acid-binding Zn-ribbon protein